MATKAQRLYGRLMKRLKEIASFNYLTDLQSWDGQVMMPRHALPGKGEIRAAVKKRAFELFTSDEVGGLLEELMVVLDELPVEKQAHVRLLYACRQRACSLSSNLVGRYAEATTASHAAWLRAKEADDFSIFQPELETVLALTREKAECIGYEGHPYNALLPYYEPGMTVSRIREILDPLAEPLGDLLSEIRDSSQTPSDLLQRGNWPPDAQRKLCQHVKTLLGFPGRLDEAEHPMTITVAPRDVRITTHCMPNRLDFGLTATTHEAGHGFMEWYRAQPLRWSEPMEGGGISMAVHESCSRLWEHLVGTSLPFCELIYPKVCELFPVFEDQGISAEDFWRMLNRVEPGFIRVMADELTYCSHILMRLELELAMFSGQIKVADLPSLWNEASERHLGIVPPTLREGVLQDIHWSKGFIGYFPEYMVGTLLSAIWAREIRKLHPDLDDRIRRGQFSVIQTWMREHVYCWGQVCSGDELVRRATGHKLSAKPWLGYARRKYQAVYQV